MKNNLLEYCPFCNEPLINNSFVLADEKFKNSLDGYYHSMMGKNLHTTSLHCYNSCLNANCKSYFFIDLLNPMLKEEIEKNKLSGYLYLGFRVGKFLLFFYNKSLLEKNNVLVFYDPTHKNPQEYLGEDPLEVFTSTEDNFFTYTEDIIDDYIYKRYKSLKKQ